MPYKNPEDKQRWEREHREQRNARRRKQHLSARTNPSFPTPAPDPTSQQEPKGDWEFAVAIGFAVLVCIGLLAAWAGVGTSLDSGPGRPSA